MSPSPDEHPVRIARLAKDWRLEDLSAETGCSKPKLSNIEHGLVPQQATMETIADALGVTPAELWPDDYVAPEPAP